MLIAIAKPERREGFWCEKYWEQCRQLQLEEITVKEKHLSKERECVQKAQGYWDMKECREQIRMHLKHEMLQLKSRLLERARH
ncbi:MAG: hypothetical protein N3D14_03995 [Aquificaceae bacterium]|nr:hypothetical protein [Aquificaceae bacterium]